MKRFIEFLESTFVGGGNVRGLGAVTGESSNSEDDILYYQNCNMQDADTRDNQLRQIMKNFHAAFHGNPSTANHFDNKNKSK